MPLDQGIQYFHFEAVELVKMLRQETLHILKIFALQKFSNFYNFIRNSLKFIIENVDVGATERVWGHSVLASSFAYFGGNVSPG